MMGHFGAIQLTSQHVDFIHVKIKPLTAGAMLREVFSCFEVYVILQGCNGIIGDLPYGDQTCQLGIPYKIYKWRFKAGKIIELNEHDVTWTISSKPCLIAGGYISRKNYDMSGI